MFHGISTRPIVCIKKLLTNNFPSLFEIHEVGKEFDEQWCLIKSRSFKQNKDEIITTAHVDSITLQSSIMMPGERSTEELKRHQQSLKRASAKEKMDSIDSSLSPGLLRLVNQSRDKGASSWLNAMPLADKSLALNKQEFRDSLRLRYDLPLVDLPSHCICGDKFTVSHALSCKKGGVCSAET